MASSAFRAVRGTPRLRIVKRTADGGEEVLVSNELEASAAAGAGAGAGAAGANACGPYPSPGDVVPVIAMNGDPSCTLLRETARQGACVGAGVVLG